MKLIIVLAVVAFVASAQASLQDQLVADLDNLYNQSREEAHVEFLKFYNAVRDQFIPMHAELGPIYDNFKAEVAAFPFSRLTTETSKALKAIIDKADLYLELSVLQVNPDSHGSSVNFIWQSDPNGVRSRPTPIDNWFIQTLRFNIDMMQQQIRSSSVACLEQHQSEILPFYQAPIDVVINSMIDETPNVPASFADSVASVPGTVGHTNYFNQVLNSCAAAPVAATETCIKSFLTTNVNCADCRYTDGFQGSYGSSMEASTLSNRVFTSSFSTVSMMLMDNFVSQNLYICESA